MDTTEKCTFGIPHYITVPSHSITVSPLYQGYPSLYLNLS